MIRFYHCIRAFALLAIVALGLRAAKAQSPVLAPDECGTTLNALNDYLHIMPVPGADLYRVFATDPDDRTLTFYLS